MENKAQKNLLNLLSFGVLEILIISLVSNLKKRATDKINAIYVEHAIGIIISTNGFILNLLFTDSKTVIIVETIIILICTQFIININHCDFKTKIDLLFLYFLCFFLCICFALEYLGKYNRYLI